MVKLNFITTHDMRGLPYTVPMPRAVDYWLRHLERWPLIGQWAYSRYLIRKYHLDHG